MDFSAEEVRSAGLLITGLFFPLISVLTLSLSYYGYVVHKRSSSSILIPYIGPILLDLWLLNMDSPSWVLVLPWLLDPGTILFTIRALPELLSSWWRTSRLTRQFELMGILGNQTVKISFHTTGYYHMEQHWTLEPGMIGLTATSAQDKYVTNADSSIELRWGPQSLLLLSQQDDGDYKVVEHYCNVTNERESLSEIVFHYTTNGKR